MRYCIRNDLNAKVNRQNYAINSFGGIDANKDENSLPLTYASYGYNIAMNNGVLTNSIGITTAKINEEEIPSAGVYGKKILKIFLYYRYDYVLGQRDDRIIALLSDKKVYQARITDQIFSITEMNMESVNVTFLNYHYNNKDCLLAFSDAGKMYIYDGTTVTNVNSAPRLNSACIHGGRVYGTMNVGNNRLYFSDDLNPANWNVSITEGGYISFPDEGGKVMKVLSFKNNLYVFREYCIHRLSVYSDKSDYSMNKVFVTNNLIYDKTVVICNNEIVFLSADGFYKFDGYTCTKILREIDPLISEKTYSTACFFNNKYYLATSLIRDEIIVGDEGTTLKNNGIIIFDFDLNTVEIFRGADVLDFVPLNLDYANKLLVIFNNLLRSYGVGMVDDSGTLYGVALPKKWRSPYTDLNYLNKDKVLRRIYINCDSPAVFKVKLDKDYNYNLYSLDKAQTVIVNKKTDKIGLEITTNADKFCIRGAILEFDVIKRSIYD